MRDSANLFATGRVEHREGPAVFGVSPLVTDEKLRGWIGHVGKGGDLCTVRAWPCVPGTAGCRRPLPAGPIIDRGFPLGKIFLRETFLLQEKVRASIIRDMNDFRSDLMSGAPEGMDQLVLAALRAPPAFGHREDPYQVQLESRVAEMLGFEDALLVPTCTIANQIALRVWDERGHKTVVADAYCHLVVAEAASTQILNAVTIDTLAGERGHLSPAQVETHLQAAGATPLIWLENTHMAHGGTVMPNGWLSAISKVAASFKAPTHVDGSRIWNAIFKTGLPPKEVTKGADSLSLSLTKALGAPAGSMVLGSREFIKRAVEVRSAFGASWRPIGVVSAAALHVLSNYEQRLERDHARTQHLSAALLRTFQASKCGFVVNEPDTNILLVQAPEASQADELHEYLVAQGLRCLRFGPNAIRLVVHARTDIDSIRRLIAAVDEYFAVAAGATK